jgi:hypothetical protein
MEMVDIVLGETRANQSPSVGLLASSGGPATMCDGVRQTKSASKGSLAGRGDTELTGNLGGKHSDVVCHSSCLLNGRQN